MAMVNIPVEAPMTEYLHAKASRLHIPLSGTFELTPVCNMSCRMCYVRMTKSQQETIHPLRTATDWLYLEKPRKTEECFIFSSQAGSLFYVRTFRKFCPVFTRWGLLITINSNGTLIDEKVVGWLKDTPPTRINITLYGASNKTYERLCGNPQGFTQVTKAIHLLKEAGIAIKINCSLTPYNATDLEQIFEFCRKENLVIPGYQLYVSPT